MNDIYRVLRRGDGLSGWMVSDFDCVIEENRKSHIYCINFVFSIRMHVYLRCKAPPKWKPIRLDNFSMCFPNYNADARRLFVDEPNLQVVIATGPPSRWRYQVLHQVNFSIVSH